MLKLPENLKDAYVPKKFGKEYCEISSSEQYPMFVATALGIKPVFDNLIPVEKYNDFVEICQKYDLEAVPDIVFVPSKKNKKMVIGGENASTTFSEGKRFNSNIKKGLLHMFISRSKEKAYEAKKYGWYSGIVINNRTVNKPFVDNLRFGITLGYPKCCVNFFRQYNNWHFFNHSYEVYRNTGTEKGSYLCNNYLMDYTFFLIHHLPCSYRCKKTIEYAKKVKEAIQEVEPEFIKKTENFLKKPLLVFQEHNFILFDGILDSNVIKYQNCSYISNPGRPEASVYFFKEIKQGDEIVFESTDLIVKKGGKELITIKRKPDWIMLEFE